MEETSEENKKAKSGWLDFIKRRIRGLAEVVAFLAVVGLIASLFGRLNFLFDLCTHFRPQAMVALLLCGVVILIFGGKKTGFLALSLGVILGMTFLPYLIPNRSSSSEANLKSKRLLLMNVLTSNQDKAGVVRFLEEQDPDIFVLLETDRHWMKSVTAAFQESHPHHREMPRSDNFGICLFSKLPFTDASIVEWGEFRLPSIDASFDDSELGAFRVIGTHPVPPMRSEMWTSRNEQLVTVAKEVATKPVMPTLVVGDFNSTPWSPFYQDFLESSGMRDSAKGFGIRPTWFAGPKYEIAKIYNIANLWMFALPLDHICVSEHISILERKVGPNLGSDHRAVTLDFSIP